MERVTRTTNAGDPMMARHSLKVNHGDREKYSKTNNEANKEKQWQSMYRGVWSDPYTNGRAAIKFVKPLNYYGINHFTPLPTRQLYLTGLKTGGGRDPLPPLLPPRQFTMCG